MPDILELKSDLISLKQHIYSLTRDRVDIEKGKIESLEKILALRDPMTNVNEQRRELVYLTEKLSALTNTVLESNKSKFSLLAGKLDTLSPLNVISRGYALVEKEGKPITQIENLQKGDKVVVKLSNGQFKANITDIGE